MQKVLRLFIPAVLAAALCGVGFARESGYRTPFSSALEKAVRMRRSVQKNPGMNRLYMMRFYFPSGQVPVGPGFWERLFDVGVTDQHVRATAFYLFNMYVSTAAYATDVPGKLTFNYLGVLDGFGMARRPFDASKAASFYQEHKKEIKAWLTEFFAKAKLPAYNARDPLNDRRELAFLQVLARSAHPAAPGGGYRLAEKNLLRGAVNVADKELLAKWLRRAVAQGRRQVVVFEQPQPDLSALDTKIKPFKSTMQRLYRYVSDECNYCSYLFGRYACEAVASRSANWGLMRIYRVVARPASGEFLRPAQGEHFVLADGASAPPWRYHTATLLIMNRDGRFTPVVADKFLTGESPAPFEEWVKKFSAPHTVFSAVPFTRSERVENAIKTPEERRGKNVVVAGKVFEPYPVLK